MSQLARHFPDQPERWEHPPLKPIPMTPDPTPQRLDQPDVTETERALIRQLRTSTGHWNGDETALRVLRGYTIITNPRRLENDQWEYIPDNPKP